MYTKRAIWKIFTAMCGGAVVSTSNTAKGSEFESTSTLTIKLWLTEPSKLQNGFNENLH